MVLDVTITHNLRGHTVQPEDLPHEYRRKLHSCDGSSARLQVYQLAEPVYKDYDSIMALLGFWQASGKVHAHAFPLQFRDSQRL